MYKFLKVVVKLHEVQFVIDKEHVKHVVEQAVHVLFIGVIDWLGHELRHELLESTKSEGHDVQKFE